MWFQGQEGGNEGAIQGGDVSYQLRGTLSISPLTSRWPKHRSHQKGSNQDDMSYHLRGMLSILQLTSGWLKWRWMGYLSQEGGDEGADQDGGVMIRLRETPPFLTYRLGKTPPFLMLSVRKTPPFLPSGNLKLPSHKGLDGHGDGTNRNRTMVYLTLANGTCHLGNVSARPPLPPPSSPRRVGGRGGYSSGWSILLILRFRSIIGIRKRRIGSPDPHNQSETLGNKTPQW